jgi:hypothetical protein
MGALHHLLVWVMIGRMMNQQVVIGLFGQAHGGDDQWPVAAVLSSRGAAVLAMGASI